MAVRSSWVDLSVDGRNTDIGTGPKALKGTMTARFKVREKGCIINSVTVETIVYEDRKNSAQLCQELIVKDKKGRVIHTHKTYL